VSTPPLPTSTPLSLATTGEFAAAVCSPLERQELEEARALVLECARKHGELDAKEGVTIPPAEFCEDNKASKMLREAWLKGWHSANDRLQRSAEDDIQKHD